MGDPPSSNVAVARTPVIVPELAPWGVLVSLATLLPSPGRAALRRPHDLRFTLTGFPAVRDVRVERDLPVRTRDGTRLALDLYRSPLPGARPAIVLVYGGAWIFGSRGDTAEIGHSFAHLGYTARNRIPARTALPLSDAA